MKGQLSVDPTFTSLGIKRPTIHSRSPLVAHDSHRLYNNMLSIPWESKGIINCAFIQSLSVLMVLCSDWKLYIYNKNMELIAKLSDWESKYSVGFEYIEKLNMFLLVGVIEIQTLKVNIKTNLKDTKFLSSVKFNIQRKELRVVQEKYRLSWNKGFGYDLSQNLLYVWSTQNINFYSLNKLQLRSAITKLVKKQAAITYVHFNSSYKYTITGLINGNVKVWRLPISPVSSSEYIMIHNCIHHTKTIQKIVPSNDDRVIISSSIDLTLCLWSLQTFQLLRVYNFDGQYSQVFLVDYKKAYAIQNNQLGQLVFGKTMQFILEVDSNITYFDKYYKTIDNIHSFQLTLQSNVGIQILGKDLLLKDLNKIDISYFYPPLKAQSIKQVLCSLYDPQIYYMLVQNGQLFSVRIENNSSKIQQSFSLQHTLDNENHSLNQNPTFIAFLDLCDIQFDSQVIQSSLSHRVSTKKSISGESASRQFKLITIGCSKGSIIILSLNNIEKIRTRLTYHRQSILSIQVVQQKQINSFIMVSLCAEDYLRMINLEHDKAVCFLTIFCGQSLKFFRSFDDKLALVFKKGIFEISRIVGPSELKVLQNLDAIDHEGQIFALDYQPLNKLVMTCGSDNKIKIWSLLKVLIFEIKLDEGLRYTIWSNNLEILVSHRNKLLYLRDLHIDTSGIEDYQDIDIQNQKKFVEVDIKQQFFIIRKDLPKSKKGLEQHDFLQIPQFRKSKKKVYSLLDSKPDISKEKASKIESYLQQPSSTAKKNKKDKSVKKVGNYSFTANLRSQEEDKKKMQLQANTKAMRKHIEQINNVKKLTNQSLLPKIQPRNEDRFEQFINAKLISKKMLTRRDITLNRIIMKNLIKEQFSQEDEQLSSLKLDF